MTARNIERINDAIVRLTGIELIIFLHEERFLRREYFCQSCGCITSLNKYRKNIDEFGWRCTVRNCSKFKIYVSIRTGSFFEGLNCSFKHAIQVILGYACRNQRHSIERQIPLSQPTILKITKKLTNLMTAPDFSDKKMGGIGKVVQVDETMLNYKCKSHRGRSSTNRTDSLCIIEFERSILRAYAVVIPNKTQATIVPIICSQVNSGSIIHTDEHGAYYNLRNWGFYHGSVCHKYEFVNRITGVHTQGIESFHSELKLEIKKRKGIRTVDRPDFLREFCFYFNHREAFDDVVLELIKI